MLKTPSPAMLGARLAVPLIAGYLPVAFAFGIVGRVAGLPAWSVVAMSFFVYAGASQFAALQLMVVGGSLPSIVSTTFIINLRHMLLSASIAPRLSKLNRAELVWFSMELTDEAYAVHDSEYRRHTDRPKREIFVLNGLVHLSWVLGTTLGVFVGDYVGNIKALGLDFALIAMFIAILVIDAVKSSHDLMVASIGGIAAVVLTVSGYSLWATVIATCAAATIGCLVDSEDP